MLATDKIICPHCNYADEDWHEYVDPTEMEGTFVIECVSCFQPVKVEMSTIINFFTTVPREEEMA